MAVKYTLTTLVALLALLSLDDGRTMVAGLECPVCLVKKGENGCENPEKVPCNTEEEARVGLEILKVKVMDAMLAGLKPGQMPDAGAGAEDLDAGSGEKWEGGCATFDGKLNTFGPDDYIAQLCVPKDKFKTGDVEKEILTFGSFTGKITVSTEADLTKPATTSPPQQPPPGSETSAKGAVGIIGVSSFTFAVIMAVGAVGGGLLGILRK